MAFFVKVALSFRDALLALAIVFIWGSNFVVTKLALDAVPPLTLATVRFFFVVFPAILFLPRPQVAWLNLIGYGFCVTVLQFSFLFIAMDGFLSPGLASLVAQTQAFFFVAIAMVRHGERLRLWQVVAMGLAIGGIGLIMIHNGQGATITGVLLTLGAAISWAVGNQISKEAGPVPVLAYVVWGNLFAVPLLAVAALLHEGPGGFTLHLAHASLSVWACIFWLTTGNSLFGYSAWAWLIRRYAAATIAPFSLLVPVIALGSSAALLGESLPAWKLIATLLVIAGVAINLFETRRTPDEPPTAEI